jgi:hypothetical protein
LTPFWTSERPFQISVSAVREFPEKRIQYRRGSLLDNYRADYIMLIVDIGGRRPSKLP